MYTVMFTATSVSLERTLLDQISRSDNRTITVHGETDTGETLPGTLMVPPSGKTFQFLNWY